MADELPADLPDPAIVAQGLVKAYGKVRAVDGIDLTVPRGSVLGLLGPNGAGKTTIVRLLTTLVAPDAGRATVLGFDIVRQRDEVRRRLGLSGQYAAVDENLTARENLDMIGRLYHLGRKVAKSRADELIQSFDLAAAASRPVRTFSGGMRRRLDLAGALIARPPLVVLDEPTTGLDPQGRNAVWDLISELVDGGTTLLLTTQYLDEADKLASLIVVIDHGKAIARGTSDRLKAQVGGQRIEAIVRDRGKLEAAVSVLASVGDGAPRVDVKSNRVTVAATLEKLPEVIYVLRQQGVEVEEVGLRLPTLDEVFLTLTGGERGEHMTPDVTEARPR